MKSILLIEDNNDVRSNIVEILALAGYNVISAENGKVGLEKAIKYSPDLILCDIVMPALDGYEVLKAIQANISIKHIPFIFLTAKANNDDIKKGLEFGADAYITKPFRGIELLNSVSCQLNK
ncbi:MAG: transcriptional regulator [Ferruginibacter sp.]|uniref:response regulator transcription factor n=1 Tax=Ferruginibacter sp. TaxID=1940288 RepID=UPI0026580877|nr:response regulator [Ferruginibacter sp.]MDB5275686.1 transcriptional regulator [Ferruginibacter sp.]